MLVKHTNPNEEHFMNFQPKSEEQIEAERIERMKLLDTKLIYDFEITNGYETKSRSSGRDMLAFELKVFHEGGTKQVKDYIVPDTQMDKLFQFCKSIGKEAEYHTGTLDADDCVGCGGKVKLSIEPGSPDGKGGKYPDKNKIGYYQFNSKILANSAPPVAAKPAAKFVPATEDDDDIPF